MKVTKQDKRDIDKTILYLNEVAEYIDMLKGCRDGTPSWKPSVIDACDVAVEWLERIKKEGNKQDKLKYDKEDYSYEFELDQKKTDHKTDHKKIDHKKIDHKKMAIIHNGFTGYNKTQFEIVTNKNDIYLCKEKNPGTKHNIYIIDVFLNHRGLNDYYPESEVFDD